jgi:hypothetical protein
MQQYFQGLVLHQQSAIGCRNCGRNRGHFLPTSLVRLFGFTRLVYNILSNSYNSLIRFVAVAADAAGVFRTISLGLADSLHAANNQFANRYKTGG